MNVDEQAASMADTARQPASSERTLRSGAPFGDDDRLSLGGPTRDALAAYLLAWADDELVLGHRDSEWTGFAPQIEEDVAFSSIAQDEIGHAALLYGITAELTGDDADRLALRRPAEQYRHAALLARPNGDWAHTIARHYLYDLADSLRLVAASGSSFVPLAGAARKMAREEHYHRLHGAAWWDRLGDGTPESRDRLTAALRALLPLVAGLFGATPGEELLRHDGIAPRPAGELYDEWRGLVRPLLEPLDASLVPLLDRAPEPRMPGPPGDDFRALHAEMTLVSASGLGERW